MKNWGDNVFEGIPVGREEASLFGQFVSDHDFAAHTRKAYSQDVRKFAGWFASANREPFVVGRVTTRDVADFRDHLRRQQGQAVATVNRCLVAVRKFFEWLADRGHVAANPAKRVKELRRQQLAPKGLEKSQVRRLLRELELRGDVRATAIFSVMLYAGLRVADVAGLELRRPDPGRTKRFAGASEREGQQATVGAVASSGSPGVGGVLGDPPARAGRAGFHRGAGTADGTRHPGLVRQVFCPDRRSAASAPAAAHVLA